MLLFEGEPELVMARLMALGVVVLGVIVGIIGLVTLT